MTKGGGGLRPPALGHSGRLSPPAKALAMVHLGWACWGAAVANYPLCVAVASPAPNTDLTCAHGVRYFRGPDQGRCIGAAPGLGRLRTWGADSLVGGLFRPLTRARFALSWQPLTDQG